MDTTIFRVYVTNCDSGGYYVLGNKYIDDVSVSLLYRSLKRMVDDNALFLNLGEEDGPDEAYNSVNADNSIGQAIGIHIHNGNIVCDFQLHKPNNADIDLFLDMIDKNVLFDAIVRGYGEIEEDLFHNGKKHIKFGSGIEVLCLDLKPTEILTDSVDQLLPAQLIV